MWYIPDEEQTGTSAINQWICPLPGNSEQNAQDSADPETKGETNNKHVSADINIQNTIIVSEQIKTMTDTVNDYFIQHSGDNVSSTPTSDQQTSQAR